MRSARSTTRIVRSTIDIKFWLDDPPPISTVRPAACGECGYPVVIGHGIRRRHLLGPSAPETPPARLELFLRRFRCTACAAVFTVAPAEVASLRRYALTAIAWAVALFGHERLAVAEVRRRIRPDPPGGFDDGWRTLRRWIRQIAQGRLLAPVRVPPDGTYRDQAQHITHAIAARFPSSTGITQAVRIGSTRVITM